MPSSSDDSSYGHDGWTSRHSCNQFLVSMNARRKKWIQLLARRQTYVCGVAARVRLPSAKWLLLLSIGRHSNNIIIVTRILKTNHRYYHHPLSYGMPYLSSLCCVVISMASLAVCTLVYVLRSLRRLLSVFIYADATAVGDVLISFQFRWRFRPIILPLLLFLFCV